MSAAAPDVRPSRDRRAVLDRGRELIGGLKQDGFGAVTIAACVSNARVAADVLFMEQPHDEKAFSDQRVVYAVAKALGVDIAFTRPVPVELQS